MGRESGRIDDCLQNEPPFCTDACPFHLDVRDFIGKMQRGGLNAAYRMYVNAVAFPGIVTALCNERCKGVCPRRLTDAAVSMRLLETAALTYARNTEPVAYSVPPKNKRVGIVGAGISGLACALRLVERKYEVTVFERTGRIGGHLHALLPSEVVLADIQRQFLHAPYELRLSTEIANLDALGCDAVYVATGTGGSTFGLTLDPGGAFASNRPGVFLGGSLTGADTMHAIANGLRAFDAIERYLKVGAMNHPLEASGTKLQLDPSQIARLQAVIPADGKAFTRDEAVTEAQRCLKCACDACLRFCDLMKYFKKTPKRIDEEVQITIQPGTLDGNGTVATRLISTCNYCGLCKEVCPQAIDTGELLLASHRKMREKGAMPWAFHDFFLRDMAFANGEARLTRRPIDHERSRYVFFPGCQLGGSDPRYVTESYRTLLDHWPDTALMLGCCGAPAEWAGDERIRDETTSQLREDWIALGKPTAIFACPSCKQVLRQYLPEVEGIFLYDLLLRQGLSPATTLAGEIASVFDPCASREEPGVQQAVRELARRAGFTLEPLPREGRLAECCSWGGQISVTNPRYARHVVEQRVAAGPRPYITYCINCRDVFADAGKPAWHILDVLLGLNLEKRSPPTATGRRMNRLALKRTVLERFWNEQAEQESERMDLIIAPELKQKLSDELLLETDIAALIEQCERTGRKVLNPTTGTFTGHQRVGNMTCWAEYRLATDGRVELVNAYCHRMSIEET